MSEKIDPKHPIENWKFEVVIDNVKALDVLTASTREPFSLRDALETFGKALANSHKYLECNNFHLLEDGTLIAQPPLARLPNFVLVIDMMETFNRGALAGLDIEISARKVQSEFNPWHVTGYLKSNLKRQENLVLDDQGNLYFHDARSSWNALRKIRFADLGTSKGAAI
jgi:hypothetical protein